MLQGAMKRSARELAEFSNSFGRVTLRSRDLTVAPRSEGFVRRVGKAAILSLPIRIHDNKVVAPYRRVALAIRSDDILVVGWKESP